MSSLLLCQSLQRKRAAEEAQREATFQQLYSDVLGGLEPGSGVLSEAQEVLQYAEATQQARKEALYQQWHSQVFEPIQVCLQAVYAGVWAKQAQHCVLQATASQQQLLVQRQLLVACVVSAL